jgi:phage repressor protein C with HTH and peptisase S24 domain
MEINEKIQKLLDSKAITAYELSLKSKVPHSSISRILNGETKKLSTKNKKLLSDFFKVEEDYFNNGYISEIKNIDFVEEPVTNYYYPDVNASAGLETEMQNDELKRIPINIPNWEKGVSFINVYGDSMYPKYCSGEIIGIKEVEPQYINYGYAYVVIFNDGQVFLKYIRKGKDNDHWLLDSENPKYESREYHLSLIKKVFIIKGVITKTTM